MLLQALLDGFDRYNQPHVVQSLLLGELHQRVVPSTLLNDQGQDERQTAESS